MLEHTRHTLQDTFENSGSWWLPEHEATVLPGRLTYDPIAGVILELDGDLTPPSLEAQQFHPDIVLGVLNDGTPCCLIRNVGSLYPRFPGTYLHRFQAQVAFLGTHFPSIDAVRFSNYQVNFAYLEEWTEKDPFKTELIREAGRPVGYNISCQTRMLYESAVSAIDGKMSLHSRLDPDISPKRLHIEREVFFSYRPHQPQVFERCRAIFFDLQNFLTLLMGESTYPKKIRAYTDDNEARKFPISVFTRFSGMAVPASVYHVMMPFPFPAIASRLPLLLSRWFENSLQLRGVHEQFFSTQYKPDMYLENTFLNLIHAVESYHREVYDGQYLPDEDYDSFAEHMRQSLPARIPDGLRDSFKNKIKYGNQYSLRKRLEIIFNQLDQELKELMLGEMQDFKSAVVATRNYLVHRDRDDKSEALDTDGMYDASQRLEVLLIILLLQSIGFDNQEIKARLGRNFRFNRLG